MIITTALANEIVARAMAIIHHNVNVIDHHGQIIASGERHVSANSMKSPGGNTHRETHLY
ncbi:sugar diacid utilization regulator SdaR [Klebsiella pneumoniae]|uniref:Sugar diacid utilization regulator SdaR n=1 Tax=Klebsiella pneumoniae TaxID=573 RepID=A0A377V1M8_KLEPN|nr:sugar diacid utilization regulator SdaR [Klebsiella pneumoniae]